MTRILLPILILFLFYSVQGQDPATFNFNQHGSVINPAMAGTGGSQSISLAYRQEWISNNDNGYQTILLAYNESMPCSVLDYSINAMWDKEGDGLLNTYEISPNVSVNIPLLFDTRNQVNLRLGGGMSFGGQQIQFDRLVFSDQLDPKYGNIFPTNFELPDENLSSNYIQPAIGFVLQAALNKLNQNAIIINTGASYHNAYGTGPANKLGYGKSILGLLPPQSPRFAVHLDVELMPSGSKHFSVKPSILYERQEALYYIQYGLNAGLTNAFRVGGFFHQQKPGSLKNTNWLTINTIFRPYLGEDRIDIYFAYSFNISGLRNAVNPLFEIGIKKHFKNSFTCSLMGKEDSYEHNKFKCPWFAISPAKKKIYGNVWY